jgi:regulator of protease activity HflC (stomatin/prohibitin superfamily)
MLELVALGTVALGVLGASLKSVTEYDRLVVFRFGRVTDVRGPGPTVIMPFIESYKKVDLRMVTMTIPMQEIITKDNVSAKTAAVCFFQVVDPYKVITKIEDPYSATSQIAQTTLRSVLGQHELDEILSERDVINAKLQAMIDRQTEGWGIKVNSVEIKDVEIPEMMQRAMARQAEAERERRAKVVAAEGEHQAAEKLALAAELIAAQPGAMQLRQLQTMVEVASEKNSTLIFPIPIELLSFTKNLDTNAAANVISNLVAKQQQQKEQSQPAKHDAGETITLKKPELAP